MIKLPNTRHAYGCSNILIDCGKTFHEAMLRWCVSGGEEEGEEDDGCDDIDLVVGDDNTLCPVFFFLPRFPRRQIRTVDAVVLTHEHADAIFGLDDLRGLQPYTLKSKPVEGQNVDYTGGFEAIAPMPVHLNEHTFKVSEGGRRADARDRCTISDGEKDRARKKKAVDIVSCTCRQSNARSRT